MFVECCRHLVMVVGANNSSRWPPAISWRLQTTEAETEKFPQTFQKRKKFKLFSTCSTFFKWPAMKCQPQTTEAGTGWNISYTCFCQVFSPYSFFIFILFEPLVWLIFDQIGTGDLQTADSCRQLRKAPTETGDWKLFWLFSAVLSFTPPFKLWKLSSTILDF